MLLRHRSILRRRSGASLAEMAIVSSVFFLLLFGIIVGGLAVFRFHQVATLAREGARWASTHGSQFSADYRMGTLTTESMIKDQMTSRARGLDLDPARFRVTVFLETPDTTPPTSIPWDASDRSPNNALRAKMVRVRLEYQWVPEVFLFGSGFVWMRGESAIPMNY